MRRATCPPPPELATVRRCQPMTVERAIVVAILAIVFLIVLFALLGHL